MIDKNDRGRSPWHTARVDEKNQITVPASELRAAGLEPGDVVRVDALGVGRLVLTRVDTLLARYAGRLDTGGALRRELDELREGWGGPRASLGSRLTGVSAHRAL